MITPVSNKTKKRFLKWFLNNYDLKRDDNVWVLDYFIQHDHFLSNIHFVSDVINYPKGIMMSCHCSNEVDFRFHKKHIVTDDINKSFHDIRLHPNERMYIQLNFCDASINPFYQTVLEDRYFSHENKRVVQHDREIADQLLNKVMADYKRDQLRHRINMALDHHDKRSFFVLSDEWNKITERSPIGKRTDLEI